MISYVYFDCDVYFFWCSRALFSIECQESWFEYIMELLTWFSDNTISVWYMHSSLSASLIYILQQTLNEYHLS